MSMLLMKRVKKKKNSKFKYYNLSFQKEISMFIPRIYNYFLKERENLIMIKLLSLQVFTIINFIYQKRTLGCFEKRNEQWIQTRKKRMEKTAETLTN